jgi:hypothetical protein
MLVSWLYFSAHTRFISRQSIDQPTMFSEAKIYRPAMRGREGGAVVVKAVRDSNERFLRSNGFIDLSHYIRN